MVYPFQEAVSGLSFYEHLYFHSLRVNVYIYILLWLIGIPTSQIIISFFFYILLVMFVHTFCYYILTKAENFKGMFDLGLVKPFLEFQSPKRFILSSTTNNHTQQQHNNATWPILNHTLLKSQNKHTPALSKTQIKHKCIMGTARSWSHSLNFNDLT